MVDILIYEKKKAINMVIPPYLPEEERDKTQKSGKLDQTVNEEKQIIKEERNIYQTMKINLDKKAK